MQRTKTVMNTCTGETSTEILVKGSNNIENRYTRRLVVSCRRNITCGEQQADYEQYEQLDRCLRTTQRQYGNECPVTICPYYGSWQPWEACSTSCDLGTRRRIRHCIGGVVGQGFCQKGDDGVTNIQA